MKRFLISLFFVSTAFYLNAQSGYVAVQAGVATFRMAEQKTLQQDIKRESGLPVRVVDNFPPFFTFGGTFALGVGPKVSLGISYNYMSTGGRLHYEDYSGHVSIVQLLKASEVGFLVQHRLTENQQWPLYGTLNTSLIFTREKMNNELVLGSEQLNSSYRYKSVNIGLMPGLMLERKIGFFMLQASLGLQVNAPGQLKDADGAALTDASGDPVTAQWGGVRSSIGVAVPLSKKVE